MPKKNDIPVMTSVTLTPLPGGYYLDAWLDGADPAAGGETMKRFRFDSVQQMVDFSKESRRVALLSVGYEELPVTAGDVREDDLLPMMNGGAVDSVDVEKKYAEIVPTSELDELVEYRHFTFNNSSASVSMKADERLVVLRKIN